MIRSLRTGVSGLKSHQVRMDVISNNIANVNTTAFKRGRAAFNELLGQTLLGVGRTAGGRGINPAYVGLGVSVGSIDVNFAQGALENTGVATDLGINGDGFFVVRGGDRIYLTRAGNFTINRFGELVTNTGLQVQGWAFDENGELRSAALEDVRIPLSATAPPKLTENIFVRGNLSAEVDIGESVTVSTVVYDPQGRSHTVVVKFTKTEDNAWEWQVLDALGNPITEPRSLKFNPDGTINVQDEGPLTYTFTGDFVGTNPGNEKIKIRLEKTGPTEWTWQAFDEAGNPILDDTDNPQMGVITMAPDGSFSPDTDTINWDHDDDSSTANISININFNEVGDTLEIELPPSTDKWVLTRNTDKTLDLDGDPNTPGISSALKPTFTWDIDGDGNDETFTLNFFDEDGGLTQFAGSTTATIRDQDGRPPGSLIGFSINQEGIVELNFSNGYQQKIYQIALGMVNNVNGLQQEGDNLWSLTSASGELTLGRAGAELNRTAIVAGTLEMSNVDLATEFTDMIVTQRGYQASARIITTSDEMLQELVQLKR